MYHSCTSYICPSACVYASALPLGLMSLPLCLCLALVPSVLDLSACLYLCLSVCLSHSCISVYFTVSACVPVSLLYLACLCLCICLCLSHSCTSRACSAICVSGLTLVPRVSACLSVSLSFPCTSFICLPACTVKHRLNYGCILGRESRFKPIRN